MVEKAFESFVFLINSNKIKFYFRELNNGQEIRIPPQELLLNYTRIYFDSGFLLTNDIIYSTIEIMVEESILELIEKRINQNTHFNHFVHTNQLKKELDTIFAEMSLNEKYIQSTYGKNSQKITGKELARFCKEKIFPPIIITERRGTEIMKLIKLDSSYEDEEDDVQQD